MAKMDFSIVIDEMGKEARKMFYIDVMIISVFIPDEQ